MDILIVEDNKELLNLLTDFLRAEGYTVSTAENGEKALSLYEKYGARPLKRAIQTKIEDALADEILSGQVKRGCEVTVTLRKGKIVFDRKEKVEKE